jgi:hypothetical protein
MSELTCTTWLGDGDLLAVALDRRTLQRWFGNDLVVPSGCRALLDGTIDPLPAGAAQATTSNALLFKEAPFLVEVAAPKLQSCDGHEITLAATCSLCLELTPSTRSQIAALLNGRTIPVLERHTLAAAIEPTLVKAFDDWVSTSSVDTLLSCDEEQLEPLVRRWLAGTLEARGLSLSRIRSLRVRCPAIEELRRLRAQAEQELHRQALAHAHERAEHAHRLELERLAFEQQLERNRQAQHELAGADLGVLISQHPDEHARERLYQLLIRQHMSPEQIAALATEQAAVSQRDQLRTHSERLASHAVPPRSPAPITRRVLVACGTQVLAIDPHSNIDPRRPREIYEAGPDSGGLRSVRLATDRANQRWLLAGSQAGVTAWPIDEPTAQPRRFPIARGTKGRTGINAMVLTGDELWATHSEFGLLRWRWNEPGSPASPEHCATTAQATAVRGLTGTATWACYAVDTRVYGFIPGQPVAPQLYRGANAPISALVYTNERVIATTLAGSIYAWRHDDGFSPTVIYRRQAKIYMARLVSIDGAERLLIGSRDCAVVSRSLVDHAETVYQATSLVRWADGASDVIAAVDYDSMKLILWRSDMPDNELRRIEAPQPINDICMLASLAPTR